MSRKQIEILDHTAHRAAKGFFCGDSPEMKELVEAGLMVSAGWKSFVPEEFFELTEKGFEYLGEKTRFCEMCRRPTKDRQEVVIEHYIWRLCPTCRDENGV
jgi:hypothetical protein